MKTLRGCAIWVLMFTLAHQASAQSLTDFESYANGTQVIFRDPGFSGSTSGKIDTATDFSGVVDNPVANPNPTGGAKVYNSSWSFSTNAAPPLWVRLSTFGTANLPNTTVDFSQAVKFDMFTDSALYVALGLRETSTAAPIGGDGGSSGTIEFVGGTTDNTPSPVLGRLVPANTWVTLQFNIPIEPVRGFTGDGVLTSTTGKGVLEMLTLVPVNPSDITYSIYLDNFAVVPVPEPSTVALLALGALALGSRLIRRKS